MFEGVAVEVVGVGLLTIGITTLDHARVLLYLEPHETAQILVYGAQAIKERIDDPYDDTFHAYVTEEPLTTN